MRKTTSSSRSVAGVDLSLAACAAASASAWGEKMEALALSKLVIVTNWACPACPIYIWATLSIMVLTSYDQ
jgi:hypothetical protein